MAQLDRNIMKVFADTAGVDEVGEIGSRAAGNPQTSKDITQIQSRSQYDLGWFQTTIRQTLPDGTQADLPASEDLNALFFLLTTQAAYLYQNGIPEWLNSADQRYYGNVSFVQVGGDVYQALQGDDGANINSQRNPATEPDWWRLIWSRTATAFYRNLTGTTTINLSEGTPPKVIEISAGTPFTLTLNGFVAPPGSGLMIQNTSPDVVTLAGSSGLSGTIASGQTAFAISDNNSMIQLSNQTTNTSDDVTFNDVTSTGNAVVSTIRQTALTPRTEVFTSISSGQSYTIPAGTFYVGLRPTSNGTAGRIIVQNSLDQGVILLEVRDLNDYKGTLVFSDGTNVSVIFTTGAGNIEIRTVQISP